MKELILAIDQGTTGSSATFFDAQSLALVSTCKKEFPQLYPAPGWVEHSPDAIWQSVAAAVETAWAELQTKLPATTKGAIQAIGITNQRETVVAWDRQSGAAAANAIVWQDRRTADICAKIAADETLRKRIVRSTGLVCDPYFSGSKMQWLLENASQVQALRQRGTLALGTIDSYLMYRLSNGDVLVTEHTNASRTMLYDLASASYHDDLLALFGVQRKFLAEIRPSIGLFARTRGLSFLPDGIPITGCLGDQQAALFGHAATAAGEGKITYGTGTFLLMAIGDLPRVADNGLLTTVAVSFPAAGAGSVDCRYALEGSAFIAGAAVQFIRDNFKWITSAAEAEALACASKRDPNVIFIPALAGLGAPYWNPHAKGALLGLSRGTDRSQIMRAVLESIALQNVLILRLMQQSGGVALNRLGVDGGAAKSNYLMQFQSDVARAVLARPPHTEITALGAARAALLGLQQARALPAPSVEREFSPVLPESDADAIVARWQAAAAMVDNLYRGDSRAIGA